MKYLNTTKLQKALRELVEESTVGLRLLRLSIIDSLASGDDLQAQAAFLYHIRADAEVRTLRSVLELLDTCTVDLHTHRFKYNVHLDGQPAPVRLELAKGMSALLESLAASGFSAQAVAAAAIQAVKGFDQWLMAYWEDGDAEGLADVEEYQATLQDIVGSFRGHFGAPGIGQHVPDLEMLTPKPAPQFVDWSWREPGPTEEVSDD